MLFLCLHFSYFESSFSGDFQHITALAHHITSLTTVCQLLPGSKRSVQLAAVRAAQRPPAPPEPAPPAPAPEEVIQTFGGLHRRLEAFTTEENSTIYSSVEKNINSKVNMICTLLNN